MVKLIDIKDEKEWLQMRNTAIGSSEVATLFGYNQFLSPLEFFHKKIGFAPKPFNNLRLYYGKSTETLNSKIFMAYDGDFTKIADNIKNRKFKRKCVKLPELSYIVNDKFPNRISSPDRLLIENGITVGCIEQKDSSNMTLRTYVNGIPPMYEFQLKDQLCIGEYSKGYLSFIIDGGRDYKEYYFERNGIVFDDKLNGRVITEDDVQNEVNDFWGKVLLARQYTHDMKIAGHNFNMNRVRELKAMIDELEPSVDGSMAFEAYIKAEYYSIDKPIRERTGTEEDEKLAETYLKDIEANKATAQQLQLSKNKIFNTCRDGERVIFGKNKFMEVKQTKNGTKINVKI